MPANLNSLERKTLQHIQQALSMGLDPSYAGERIQGILQGAQSRVANRQAQMAPLTDALLQQAQMGGSAEGATALTNAYSAINPGVQGPGAQSKLGAFNSALYPDQGTSPIYTPEPGAGAQPLDAESLAGINQDVQAWATGAVKQPNGMPMGLHEATMAVITPLRIQGYDEATLDQVRQYIEQQWMTYGGPVAPVA
jgi:hypothetical protein